MDVEVPVLSGYVIIPQQSGFSIKPITKKVSIRDHRRLSIIAKRLFEH